MNSNATEAKVVWLGAADGLAEVRAAITKLATVPESMVRDAVEAIAVDAAGPVNNRAARRARQFGRVLR